METTQMCEYCRFLWPLDHAPDQTYTEDEWQERIGTLRPNGLVLCDKHKGVGFPFVR